MNELLACCICGVTEDKKLVRFVKGLPLCAKHKAQLYRYGDIIDPTPRTTQDKNEIIIFDDHAEIVIRNKNNTKECRAIIDLDDVEKIENKKWRIEEKQGNKIGYITSGSNKNRIYLHRYIIRYDGPLEVDHINHNTLDNRKSNLRPVHPVLNVHNCYLERRYVEPRGKKYRVKITKFKRTFLFGLYNTEQEAIEMRDKFLKFVEDHETEMNKNYQTEQKTRVYQTSFTYNGKKMHTKMFKTIEETIENRVDVRMLLDEYKKTA